MEACVRTVSLSRVLRPQALRSQEPLTTAKGSLLLGALRRRGHKEGLPSGRKAINNPEAVGSAALFKDGGGGTSAAEAGAAGQRLRRYGLREGCPARASGGKARPAVPEEPGEAGPQGPGRSVRRSPPSRLLPSPSQWKQGCGDPRPGGAAGAAARPLAHVWGGAWAAPPLPSRGLGPLPQSACGSPCRRAEA